MTIPSSTTLRLWDHAHLWHPFAPQTLENAQDEPLIIDRAEGVYLFDDKGRKYLDGVSSLWCNVHGHRHPALDAALLDQLQKVAHSTLLGATHAPAIELAHALVQLAPPGLDRVFFSDDGATAVEVALKMAFQYWRQKPIPEPARTRFLSLTGAYHGDTLGDVSVGGVERFHAMFSPLLFPSIQIPSPHCYRCPLGLSRPSCNIACLGEVERALVENSGRVAALIVEPLVQGASGMIVHPEGYLKGLRDLTHKHNTLLIADEVAVGFGRTGTLFASEQEGVTPDFLCLAKGITGGYLPLAATLTTNAIHSAFLGTPEKPNTFFHGHTYGGNPLGSAVALANLRVFSQENTLENLKPKIARLAHHLKLFASLAQVGDTRQRGFIAGIELVAEKSSKSPFPASLQIAQKICRQARAQGLLIRPLADVLVVIPPLGISLEQLDWMMDLMLRCTRMITEDADLF